MSEPSDEPTIDLFGMKVKINDAFPPNLMAIIPPAGSGLDGLVMDTKTGATVPLGFKPRYDTVAGHTERVSAIDYTLDMKNHFHDVLEAAEDELLASVRRRQERSMREALYGSLLTTTEQAEPLPTLTLESLEAMLDKFEKQQHEYHVKLIRAVLAAGLDVKVNDAAHRPMVTLPKSYQKAYDEVAREAVPDRAFNAFGFGGQMMS